MHITQAAVEKLRPLEGQTKDLVFFDDQVPGFGVRLWPSGTISYFLKYRHKGQQKKITLGNEPTMSATVARKRAMVLVGEVRDDKDPLADRNERRKSKVTFGAVIERYKPEWADEKKLSGKEDRWRLSKYFEKDGAQFRSWLTRPLLEITRKDLISLHSEITKKHPVAANRVLALLSKIWNFAIYVEMIPDGSPNPAVMVERNGETSRDRFVTEDEMPKLLRAVEEEESVYARSAIWLYLLTGLRKREVLSLRWNDIDFKAKSVRVLKTKRGVVHYLPLTPHAISLLKSLPVEADKKEWVFPGENGSRRDIRRQWDRVRKRAEIEDVTIHDLRRTLGSWLAQAQNSLHLIGSILNQTNPKTTQRYARFQLGNLRDALVSHERRVLRVRKRKPKDSSSSSQ